LDPFKGVVALLLFTIPSNLAFHILGPTTKNFSVILKPGGAASDDKEEREKDGRNAFLQKSRGESSC
jgi:hypothetical protein